MRLFAETDAPTPMELSPASNWMFEGVSVAGLIDFENVSTTVTWDPTFAVPLAGVTEVTVGAVVSAVLATVNVVTTEAVSVFPAKSRTKSCVYTWMVALAGYGCVGVNLTFAPLAGSVGFGPQAPASW